MSWIKKLVLLTGLFLLLNPSNQLISFKTTMQSLSNHFQHSNLLIVILIHLDAMEASSQVHLNMLNKLWKIQMHNIHTLHK